MSKEYKNIFITVGTTRFDRLCQTIISQPVISKLKKIGCQKVTFQIGNSNTEPREFTESGLKFNLYRFKDSIHTDILEADLVISHAGAGSCLEALEASKPLLVVVNEDLMDNHQFELAEHLQIHGHLLYCTCDTLESTLGDVDFSQLIPFPKPDASLFVKYLSCVFKVKKRVI